MSPVKWAVPYLGLGAQYASQLNSLNDAFERVMASGEFILRSEVELFEREMAKWLGVNHVVGVGSGSDALRLAVLAHGIGEDDAVITVGHTFHATHEAIYHAGAHRSMVKVADDYCMDITELEDSINAWTKAILPVHLNGRMCDMGFIYEFARKHKLAIIEDSAQSLGASFQGRKVWGTACFSSAPMKILSGAGDGGYIATNDWDIANAVQLLRNHCSPDRGETFEGYGFNSRLDNLQAAILNVKRSKLDWFIERRREIAREYENAFCDLQMGLPPAPSDGDHFDVFNSYVIKPKNAPDMLKRLRGAGVEAFSHLSKELVSLPIYPEMPQFQIGIVIEEVRKCCV